MQLQYTTQNVMDFMHTTASVTLEYAPIQCMLQVGGREEIRNIHEVSSRGKRVSLWFDSSQECYVLIELI